MKRYFLPALLAVAAFASGNSATLAAPVQWKTEDGGNGHWYELVMPDSYLDSFTWTEARAAAEAGGGYLATVTSQAENDFLRSQFAASLFDNGGEGTPPIGSRYAWIGLFAETPQSEFQWVTGEQLDFTNWAPGEPNLFGTSQWQFAHYWTRNHEGAGPSWYWNNDGNDGFAVISRQNTYGYIVETVPEPSSWILGLVGAIAFAAMGRNRQVNRH
jgi:hypothetical protein